MNMITHIVGGGLGVVVLLTCVVRAALNQDYWGIVGSTIYGTTFITMFTISSVYHGLKPGMSKKVMQVIDHCTIYFLISGTYTPVLLSAFRPLYPALGWSLFGFEWALAVLATVLTAIDLKKYSVFSMICYIGMGWCIVLILKATVEAIGWMGFWWLLAGGVAYTIGAVLYGIGGKKPVYHTVFHVFVDIGSALQAVCILRYVLGG